jgi:hypothetical protein
MMVVVSGLAILIAVARIVQRRAYAQERLAHHVSKHEKRVAFLRWLAEDNSYAEPVLSCASDSEILDYHMEMIRKWSYGVRHPWVSTPPDPPAPACDD